MESQMTVTLLERASRDDQMPMQWRGSDDAVQWTEWRTLTHLLQLVDPFIFYQGRIRIDGVWYTSPIGFHR